MEVHITGIPEFLRPDDLKKHLAPIMARLGIQQSDFFADKPRKSKWANLTFRIPQHGEAFLRKHGEQKGPIVKGSVKNYASPSFRRKASLQLMGHDIFCSLSNRPANPLTIRALQLAAEEKRNPTRKVETEGNPQVFNIRALSCGLNLFHEDRLVFAPEIEYRRITGGVAKFSKRFLQIKWQHEGDLDLAAQKIMRIRLDSVINLVYTYPNLLTITLGEEPSFFEQESELLQALNAFSVMGIYGAAPPNEPTRTRICNFDREHANVVGHCLVYQLDLSDSDVDLRRKIAVLERHAVVHSFVRYDILTSRTYGSSGIAMRILKEDLIQYTKTAELPFGIMYQLQALAWNGYLHPRTISALAEKLKHVCNQEKLTGERQISVDAMRRLFQTIDWPQPHGDATAFNADSILQQIKELEKEIRKDSLMRRGLSSPTDNLASVFRITVTPTRITLHGPELEAKNRILRKFPQHHEYFARVQFCDENGQDLFFNGRISHSQIYARYEHVLNSGIQIAGRVYSFLGFSHSSLRSHSAWFSAPFVDQYGRHQSYHVIMKELGDFSEIRCPARCAARIGQAFSETPFSISLEEAGIIIRTIPDVTSKDGSRVFSDGVGTFSPEIMYRIWDALPQNKAAPTAVQIRLQAAKGMLAADTRLSGLLVCLRESMVKFPSQEKPILEICDTASKPIPLYLNRQMIKILEDMGVDDGWFLRMQEIELSRLRAVTDSTYNVAQFLKQQNIGEGIRFYRFFRQIENMGIDYRQDPFLCSVVEASLLRELRLLKHKARIRINQGVTVFGIMDETGYLREGQVYVCFDTMNGRFESPPSHGRKLIITRSPALHPGDIQLAVQNVPPEDHPLREHRNVIIFSQHGARDLPSQLSGGDLDGDIYNVIWDVGAMPLRTFVPADYPRVKPTDLGRKVEKEDMTKFFVDFMQLDHLGVIATRHMILADQRELGTLDKDCLKLAELHSKAVDFSKNGHSVDLKALPRADISRPDFLAPGPEAHIVDKATIELDEYILEPAPDEEEDSFGNPRHRYYRSDKILGELYRAVNEQEIWNDQIHRGKSKSPVSAASFWNQYLAIMTRRYEAVVPVTERTAWISRLITARELRTIYESNVADSMSQHSEHPIRPITEIEVFVGNILNRQGVQTSRQRDSSIKLKDSFDRLAQWITKSMRSIRFDADTPLTGYQTKWDNLHLCLACVHVGGEKDAGITSEKYFSNLQSFRVVSACALQAELNLFDGGGSAGIAGGRGRDGGGFVGVRG